MSLAWISLIALAAAVTLSMLTKVNVGVVSLALAWIVGVYLGGMPLNTVIGTFPVQLFLTLAGVTLLFGMASANGTLERLAARALPAGGVLAAAGTSCRHQVAHFTGVQATHPAVLIRSLLQEP